MSEYFNVSLDYLVYGDESNVVSDSEMEMITRYRMLVPDDQDSIRLMIEVFISKRGKSVSALSGEA